MPSCAWTRQVASRVCTVALIATSLAWIGQQGIAQAASAPAFVQQVSAHRPGVGSLAVTPASAITIGNRVVVEVGIWNAAGATAASVVDAAGNHYVELLHFVASDATEMSVWTAPITAGAGTRPTITVQPTSPADIGAVALEYAGLSTVSDATVVDQMARASGTTGGAASVASGATAATAAGNELALGLYVDSGFGNALTADPTYSPRTNVSPTSDMELVAEDRVVLGGATPNATVSTGASTTWLMAMVVFKADVTASSTAPSAPTGVTASAGNASATVSWSAPSNGGSPITSYSVTPYVGTVAQAPATVLGSPPPTTTTITGLTNGTSYTFTVSATNAVGPGPASAASSPVTPAVAVVPGFVQGFSGHAPRVGSVALTPTSNVTAGDRLVVEVGIWSAVSATAASVRDSAGNKYVELLHFAASDGTEMSVWTAPITVGGGSRPTITVTPTSAADTGVAVLEYSGLSTVADASAVDVSAQASGTTGAAATVSSGATGATAGGNGLAVGFYVDSGFGNVLGAGTGYTSRVNVSPDGDIEFLAEDQVVSGGATPNAVVATGANTTWLMATLVFKPATVSAPTVPGAPTGVSAAAGNGSATVSWSAPSNGGSPITSYTVTPYVGTVAQAPATVLGSPPPTTTTVTGLTNGTSYTFTVSATNAVGPGPASAASNPVTPTTIAYPDLRVKIPVTSISIVHPTSTTRLLDYTHIIWNAGAGPWELRPNYDPTTGIAKMSQALYTATGPGQWAYVSSVPVVIPMAYDAALFKYRFPMGAFGLYSVATTGGVGSLISASPKTEYCMTEDVFVGGVPNAPAVGAYPSSNCGTPTGILGLSVGWGDQYDYQDPGQAIDITNVPDGTYWLRAQADPYHYLVESDLSNNLTDTKLTISGNTVTVITQTNPDSTPPSITVTNPASGSTVSGTVALQSAVGGPAPVISVQYIVDGSAIGSPVTSAPSYSFNWSTTGVSPGSHLLSAQATDSKGFIRTASGVPVTVVAGGAATSGTSAPMVVFANLVDTQMVTGTTPVAVNASYNVAVSSVQLLLDGKPLGPALTSAPFAYPWDTTSAVSGRHQLSGQAIDARGNVGTVPPITVVVANPVPPTVCFTVDVNQSVHGRGPVTVTGLHTGATGELLLAFVGSDGPASGSQFITVSGAGLNWTLVQRANKSRGDAEIWQAIAPNILTSGRVTATPKVPGFDASLTVIAVQGTGGVGAVAAGSARSGAPHVALTTTRANSMVFGVGNDWDSATARTPGFDQVLLNQWLDKRRGETFWSQNTALPNAPTGSRVELNDTAPASDRWNLVAVEVLEDDG